MRKPGDPRDPHGKTSREQPKLRCWRGCPSHLHILLTNLNPNLFRMRCGVRLDQCTGVVIVAHFCSLLVPHREKLQYTVDSKPHHTLAKAWIRFELCTETSHSGHRGITKPWLDTQFVFVQLRSFTDTNNATWHRTAFQEPASQPYHGSIAFFSPLFNFVHKHRLESQSPRILEDNSSPLQPLSSGGLERLEGT